MTCACLTPAVVWGEDEDERNVVWLVGRMKPLVGDQTQSFVASDLRGPRERWLPLGRRVEPCRRHQ